LQSGSRKPALQAADFSLALTALEVRSAAFDLILSGGAAVYRELTMLR
jgi:hypothetical protein